jgi:seryl-tRNA synthetase
MSERGKKMVDARFVDQARRDLASLLSLHPELEEDDVLRQDMIEAETGALELIDKLVEADTETRYLEAALDELTNRLDERAMRFARRRSALRRYIMQIMEAANLRKVERPAATVSIAAGRQKVVITDDNALPEDCVRIKREPDKIRIASHLNRGDYIPGATLSNSEPVLRIS